MILHILVTNYGIEGFTVHGVTKDDSVAQAWETANTSCRRITVNTEASLSTEPLAFEERL
jgi:hypothetical protein